MNKELFDAVDISDKPSDWLEGEVSDFEWRKRKYYEQHGFRIEDCSMEPEFARQVAPFDAIKGSKGVETIIFADHVGTVAYVFIATDAKERLENMLQTHRKWVGNPEQIEAFIAWLEK